MTEILETTEKYFADTEQGAEDLLERIKNENMGNVKKSSIDRKTTKDDEFFLVTITITHNDVKDLRALI